MLVSVGLFITPMPFHGSRLPWKHFYFTNLQHVSEPTPPRSHRCYGCTLNAA
jgi:hypothetical protein